MFQIRDFISEDLSDRSDHHIHVCIVISQNSFKERKFETFYRFRISMRLWWVDPLTVISYEALLSTKCVCNLKDLHQCHLLDVVQRTLRIMHIFCDILWYLIDRFYKNHSHRVHHHVMWPVLVTGSWRMWETIKHKSMVIKPVQINKCIDLYCQCLNSSTICAPDPLRCNVL